MCKFQKVSELEWYLEMQAFHKTFGSGYGAVAKPEDYSMDLRAFREFWSDLRAPGYNKARNEVILNAPFNIHFLLYPGQAIEIPLGFSLPDNFDIIQGKKENYIVSVKRMPGAGGGIGYILRIVNVYDKACTFQCGMGEAMISGYLYDPDQPKTKKKIIFYDKVEQYSVENLLNAPETMTYPFPGVFRQDDTEDTGRFYLAAEYNGKEPCIHIMRRNTKKTDLLRDIPVYTFTPSDFNPRLNPTEAFRTRFLLATQGEEIIPRKRYLLPNGKAQTIDI